MPPFLSPDDIVAQVFLTLNTSPAKDPTLTVLDHDLLPAEADDMPVCGVYLVEDKLEGIIDFHTNDRTRKATVRVEIRTIGTMLSTRAIREWAILAILNNQTIGGLCIHVELLGFQPFGVASDQRFAGADLDFLFTYDFSTPGSLYV